MTASYEMGIITQMATVRDILEHSGEIKSPRRMAPARGPPPWEMSDAGQGECDRDAQLAPHYEFDQHIAW